MHQAKLKLVSEILAPSKHTELAFHPSDPELICGFQNGEVHFLKTPNLLPKLTLAAPELSSPVTALSPSENGATKHLLLATYSAGEVVLWHTSSKKVLSKSQLDRQLTAADISLDGELMAVSGYSGDVYLSHVNKKSFKALQKEHSNRVFRLKFDKTDPQLFYTSGWDNTVLCWDVRTERRAWCFWGVSAVGNSLDSNERTVLAGNFGEEGKVTLIEKRMGTKLISFWDDTGVKVKNCQFTGKEEWIATTASGQHTLDIWSQEGVRQCGWGAEEVIHEMAASPVSQHVALTLEGNRVLLFQYQIG